MNSFIKAFIALLLITFTFANSNIPVIGVITNVEPENSADATKSKIYSSYIKWIELGGGQAIAIHPWTTDEELNDIFSKVNGFLLQGGDKDLNLNGQFETFVGKVVNKIIEYQEQKKVNFPLFAICQGHELILLLFSKNKDILTEFDSRNYQSPLNFEDSIIKSSRMFSYFSEADFVNLKTKETTAHFHHLGVSVQNFKNYPLLTKNFLVTSWGVDGNKDPNYVPVECFEGITYPIYGVQFHPEKVPFDYSPTDNIPQNPEAIKISFQLALFFINEARKNNNIFTEVDKKNYDFINLMDGSFINDGGKMVKFYNKTVIKVINHNPTSNNVLILVIIICAICLLTFLYRHNHKKDESYDSRSLI